MFGAAGLGTLFANLEAAEETHGKDAPVASRDALKITKVEPFLVKPRWLFLKIHTNAGITGLGSVGNFDWKAGLGPSSSTAR